MMNKWKRILPLALALVSLGFVGACGKGAPRARDVFTTASAVKTPAETLRVYTPAPGESGVAMTVAKIFQGVVNKTRPRVFLAESIGSGGVNVSAVQRSVVAEYGEVELVDAPTDDTKAHRAYSLFWSLWRDYADEIETLYLFELGDGLQDSMNVAAMLAGRNKGAAVTRELYEDLYSEGALGDRKVVDVCAEYGFTFASGSLGINRWICENMVADANRELIFLLYPGDRDEGTSSHPALYDLAVAADGLIYWIDPEFETYLSLQRDILGQFGSNALVIGWPGLNMEAAYVGSISACGKDVVCADWGFGNGSVLAGFASYEPKVCTTVVPAETSVCNNKVYVAFTVSDGDAWHYATKELIAFWNHPARGTVPITWTVPSLFAKFNPTLYEYLYATRSPLDEFIQGPSGVGYVYPTKMPDAAFTDFCEKTVSALERTKMNMVNYWDSSDTYYAPDNPRLAEYVETVRPEAVFLGHKSGSNAYFMMGDTVCINEMGHGNVSGTQTAEQILADIDAAAARTGAGKPVFVAVNVEAWGQGVSTIAEAYAELLERADAGRYEFVTSAELVGKIRKYEKDGADGTYGADAAPLQTLTVRPGTDGEEAALYEDLGSGTNPDKNNRYADETASWTYRFTFEKPVSFLWMKATLAEQFCVKVSADGATWQTALSFGGVRQGEASYLVDVFRLAGTGLQTLYVRFEDAVPTDGFGCSLTELKLYYQ